MLKSNYSFISFALAIIVVLSLSACDNGAQVNTDVPAELTLEEKVEKYVHEHWKTKMATRGGKKTMTLEGFFLDFSARDSMTTNLLGEAQKYPYKIVKTKIIQEGPQPLEFNIIEMEENNLVLKMNMRNTDFEFVMSKVKAEDPIL